jgi:hypothetical protein
MSLTDAEVSKIHTELYEGRPENRAYFTLRAQIAAQLFAGSVRDETGAAEAVAEADILLRELLK